MLAEGNFEWLKHDADFKTPFMGYPLLVLRRLIGDVQALNEGRGSRPAVPPLTVVGRIGASHVVQDAAGKSGMIANH